MIHATRTHAPPRYPVVDAATPCSSHRPTSSNAQLAPLALCLGIVLYPSSIERGGDGRGSPVAKDVHVAYILLEVTPYVLPMEEGYTLSSTGIRVWSTRGGRDAVHAHTL